MIAFTDTIWLSRKQAAEWLGCSMGTITRICDEMDKFEVDGVLRRDDGKLFRVNQKALSDFMYHRRTLKRRAT